MLFNAIWCYLVLFGAIWCHLVLFVAICCYLFDYLFLSQYKYNIQWFGANTILHLLSIRGAFRIIRGGWERFPHHANTVLKNMPAAVLAIPQAVFCSRDSGSGPRWLHNISCLDITLCLDSDFRVWQDRLRKHLLGCHYGEPFSVDSTFQTTWIYII